MKSGKLLIFLAMLALALGVLTATAYAAPTGPDTDMRAVIPDEPPEPATPDAALATAPAGAGIMNIGASTVNSVSPATISPGSTVDLCFNVTINSPDD